MGEYVSLDMGCTWKFESSLFNSNELQSLESFSLTSFGSSVSRWEIYAVQVGTLDFFKFKSRRMNVERKNRNIIYSRKP